AAFAQSCKTKLNHVKPHGALYNMAAKDKALALALAKAVYDVDHELVFVGLSGSVMIEEAKLVGLRTASEVFADRTYQDDGTLTPRTSPDAMISTPARAAQQVLQMVQRKTVTSLSGKDIPVVAETICIHGDGEHAVVFAKTIVDLLKENNVNIKKP
ncbi:MAG TPA: LamB/YcsF family protein, partial [Candidatus Saccharimonadales bacterium]|nr:LamB/YcsF family protein [Candidatus Saccharimonadales bacterium]